MKIKNRIRCKFTFLYFSYKAKRIFPDKYHLLDWIEKDQLKARTRILISSTWLSEHFLGNEYGIPYFEKLLMSLNTFLSKAEKGGEIQTEHCSFEWSGWYVVKGFESEYDFYDYEEE